MKRYDVFVFVWSNEYNQQIKKVAGTFDCYFNAKLFAEAYSNLYSATVEIVEYVQMKKTCIEYDNSKIVNFA